MALTRSQLMRIKENRKYWREREANQREAYIRTEDAELAEINKIYSDMYRWAEREVNAFYGKYADAEGIDITEAKRRVKELDIAEYEKLAKEYVKDKDFSPQANAEMRLYNATMRINRMELLKAQIGLKLVDGINDIDKHWEKIATDRATQEIIRQSGILGKTLTDTETARTAKQIVNADFYNATFSQRIWSHMDNLKSDIAIELQKGFIAGVSSREMARRLKEHAFDKSEKDAFRLARTELRRIQTDVAKDNYERNGITQYEYMAVNPSACPICRELDGRIFDVARMKAGLNAPPIHPNCHCTTAPHVDTDEYEQWLSWLERGGTTAQWDTMTDRQRNSWYDKIVGNLPTAQQPNEPRQNSRIEFQDGINATQVELIKRLDEEYENHTTKVVKGSHKSAGSADLGGAIRISSNTPETALHEFAHEIASEYRTKVGLGFPQDKDFWKEVKKVQRAYLRETEGDPTRWISSYEHGTRDVSEFMAEAFTQQKLLEYGMSLKQGGRQYGNDTTYSRQVLELIDKYYKRKRR